MSLAGQCVSSFAARLLADLGVSQSNIATILAGLERVVRTYNSKSPETSLTQIVTDLASCVADSTEKSFEQISLASTAMVGIVAVFTAIIIIIIVLALVYADRQMVFLAILVCSVLYVVGIYVIVTATRRRIGTVAGAASSSIKSCILAAENSLSQFEKQQQQAVSEALCSY